MRILTALAITACLAAAETGSKSEQARDLIKRSRETADASWLARAEDTIRGVDDFESNKVRVQILLGREEWSKAAELASKLNKKMPDDPLLYAMMADAYIALGDYTRAEKEIQFLIDLRRTSPSAMVRGAQLREVFGDTEGAMEWFTQAYRLTSASDTEERARVLTLAARMNTSIGKFDLAGKYLEQALKLQADYPFAVAQLASLRLAEGKKDDAAAAARRLPRTAQSLALLARATGDWEEFRKEARAAEDLPSNANRELALSLAASDPAEALRVASKEYARRKDISTADAYAWTLHAAGRTADAVPVIEAIVKLGTKDAGVAAHAKAIRDAASKTN